MYSANELREMIEEEAMRNFGCEAHEATQLQLYKVIIRVVRDLLSAEKNEFEKCVKRDGAKRVYYMSMEFLTGRSLKNNLSNLGILEEMRDITDSLGFDIEEMLAREPDAGLGNGGLGRLAACYMDAAATERIPCTGFSIRYEFGIFRQKITDGWQMEFPDDWLDMGGAWLVPLEEEPYEVRFDGYVSENWVNGRNRVVHQGYSSVTAVPYAMLIPGYKSGAVSELVLWGAKSPDSLDMDLFSRGEYLKSVEKNAMAEAITKVLYPADDHWEGKALRLKQQYLLVCASLMKIVRGFVNEFSDITLLPEKAAIHINDTHPSLCVPELMRILLDEHELEWEQAWDIASRTLAYTNHTVMSEALEKWPVALFREKLPRIYSIVCEIDRRFNQLLDEKYGNDKAKKDYMAIISNDHVKMANLCLACCHKVNGVSKLHSDILKNDIFRDFYAIMPDKFTNVTNGITYRRWLCQANPELCDYLAELIGDGFLKDAEKLSQLSRYSGDSAVISQLAEIKLDNKIRLANYISEKNGVFVDTSSIFDVQVKRLHEYKRQLLNILHVLHLYNKIKENPGTELQPRTFIFAAKASAGYFMAKQIIRLICLSADMINRDPQVRDRLKVVFLEDYKVSLAELIIPAAEISEQISVAGKEASGTGNMKLMINGAVTLGTLDGANVEIAERVGRENIFLFGMTADEVTAHRQSGYNPQELYNADADIKRVIDMLRRGIGGVSFSDVAASLIQGGYGGADAYMTLADFAAYRSAHDEILTAYADKSRFGRMSLENIAGAGIFSADRSIRNYAENIWNTGAVN